MAPRKKKAHEKVARTGLSLVRPLHTQTAKFAKSQRRTFASVVTQALEEFLARQTKAS